MITAYSSYSWYSRFFFEVHLLWTPQFLRYLPPLLWRELVSKGKNINWFWLEVCKKDKLKERNQKQNDVSFCDWKLFLLKSNKFLPFHTSWSSNSEGAVKDFKEDKTGRSARKKPCGLFHLYSPAELGHERSWCSLCYWVNNSSRSVGKQLVRTGYGNFSGVPFYDRFSKIQTWISRARNHSKVLKLKKN